MYEVEEHDGALEIYVPWSRWSGAWQLSLAAVLLGVSVLAVSEAPVFLVPGAFGFGLLYAGAACLLNETTIVCGSERLTIETGPVPWPFPFTVYTDWSMPRSDIGVFLVRVADETFNEPYELGAKPVEVWDLRIRTAEGYEELLWKTRNKDALVDAARQMNRWYQLQDILDAH